MPDSNSILLQAQMTFAGSALKAVTLANGGAALALLAFLGHVIGTDSAVATTTIAEFGLPMKLFAWGTVFGIIATCLSYVAQALYVELPVNNNSWFGSPGGIVRLIALCFVISAMAAFIFGITTSAEALENVSKLEKRSESTGLSSQKQQQNFGDWSLQN